MKNGKKFDVLLERISYADRTGLMREAIAKELGISPSKVVRALDRIIAENEKRYFNSLRMRKL